MFFFHIHNMKYTNLRLSWEIAYHCQNNPTVTQNAFKMQFKVFYVCILYKEILVNIYNLIFKNLFSEKLYTFSKIKMMENGLNIFHLIGITI